MDRNLDIDKALDIIKNMLDFENKHKVPIEEVTADLYVICYLITAILEQMRWHAAHPEVDPRL